MAKKAYIGVSNVAKKVKKMYVGVGGVAKKVLRGYIGINGVARLFFLSDPVLTYYTQASDLSVNRGAPVGSVNPSYVIFAGGFTYGDSNQNYSAVDVYNASGTHAVAPDLGTADSYGAGAQAGNYAVYYMYSNKIAYDTQLTKTNYSTTKYLNYTRFQACSFQNKAVFCGGGTDYMANNKNILVVDDSLTVSLPAEGLSTSVDISELASAALPGYCFAGGGWWYSDTAHSYQHVNTVVAYSPTFTKTVCDSLPSGSYSDITAASTGEHVIFKRSYIDAYKAANAYNASLTLTYFYPTDAANIGSNGCGVSCNGLAIFPGDTFVTYINTSLTVNNLPLSISNFSAYAGEALNDKVFYAGDLTANTGEANQAVHVFRVI